MVVLVLQELWFVDFFGVAFVNSAGAASKRLSCKMPATKNLAPRLAKASVEVALRRAFRVGDRGLKTVMQARDRACEMVAAEPDGSQVPEFCDLAVQTEAVLLGSGYLKAQSWPLVDSFVSARAANWTDSNANRSCVVRSNFESDRLLGVAWMVANILLPNAVSIHINAKHVREGDLCLALKDVMQRFELRSNLHNLNSMLDQATSNKCFTAVLVTNVEQLYCHDGTDWNALRTMINMPTLATYVVASGRSDCVELLARGRPQRKIHQQFGTLLSPLLTASCVHPDVVDIRA